MRATRVTGALQNHARRHRVAIDLLDLDLVLLDTILTAQLQLPVALQPPPLSVSAAAVAAGHAPPDEGVVVHGLFLEGAAWDWHHAALGESAPKVRPAGASEQRCGEGSRARGVDTRG